MYSFYLEGYHTYGKRVFTNPYLFDTYMWNEWERGYADAFSDRKR